MLKPESRLLLSLGLILGYAASGSADDAGMGASHSPIIESDRGSSYPEEARRLGLEGTVMLAFDIAANGKAVNTAVVFTDENLLVKPAMEQLAEIRFQRPHSVPGSSGRYRIGFVFCLPPSGLSDTFAVPALSYVIAASRFPGSPVRNPANSRSSGKCAKPLE